MEYYCMNEADSILPFAEEFIHCFADVTKI